MSTQKSFRDWLCLAIREVLSHQSPTPPLLLWCDPDRSWLELLREASLAGGFELWVPPSGQEASHELLIRDRFYSSPRAPRVVWLPCARDAISWFKPFELEAEEVWEKNGTRIRSNVLWLNELRVPLLQHRSPDVRI